MKRERTIKKWVKQTIMEKKIEILYIKVYKFITQFQTLDHTVSSQHGKLNPQTD